MNRDKFIEIIKTASSPEEAADGIIKLLTPKVDIDWTKFLVLFNHHTQKKHRVVSDVVKSKLKARLREGYTKDDIKNTIINAAKDDYHKETNYKHLTLEYVSRSNTIDRYSVVATKDDKIKLGLKTD